MMKKVLLFSLLLVLFTALTGCVNTVNVQGCVNPSEHVYGFWGGVWHGFIVIFSFIGSLFSDDIAIYAVNNNGGWYDFGYVGGLGFIIRGLRYFFTK